MLSIRSAIGNIPRVGAASAAWVYHGFPAAAGQGNSLPRRAGGRTSEIILKTRNAPVHIPVWRDERRPRTQGAQRRVNMKAANIFFAVVVLAGSVAAGGTGPVCLGCGAGAASAEASRPRPKAQSCCCGRAEPAACHGAEGTRPKAPEPCRKCIHLPASHRGVAAPRSAQVDSPSQAFDRMQGAGAEATPPDPPARAPANVCNPYCLPPPDEAVILTTVLLI